MSEELPHIAIFEWWCEQCRSVVGSTHQKSDGAFCKSPMRFIRFRPDKVVGTFDGHEYSVNKGELA